MGVSMSGWLEVHCAIIRGAFLCGMHLIMIIFQILRLKSVCLSQFIIIIIIILMMIVTTATRDVADCNVNL
jgi:hypothetical protein